MAGGLADGRKLRCQVIVDDCTRECLAIEVDTSLTGRRVAGLFQRLAEPRGRPRSIAVDHGPEFEGQALDAWAFEKGVQPSFIRPGKPVENAYVESINNKCRDECLNEHWFVTMVEARRVIERWRIEYNEERHHQSLKDLTPARYAATLRTNRKTDEAAKLTTDSNPGPY